MNSLTWTEVSRRPINLSSLRLHLTMTHSSTFSGLRFALFGVTVFPAAENTRSDFELAASKWGERYMWFFYFKIFSLPDPSRYPNFLASTRPVPSRSQKPLPVGPWTWASSGSLNHLQTTWSSLKAFWQVQTYIHGLFAGPWGARGSEAVWGSCCWWCWWEKYSFEKPAIFETKKTSNELKVREGWQSIFLHKNKRGWLPWRRFDKIFLSCIFFAVGFQLIALSHICRCTLSTR